VPTGGPTPLPGESQDLDVAIAGAGRMFDLDGWNAFTHGTSLVVLRHGQVVHEWYAEGVGPGDCFLGASMTKSALAHLVGVAVRAGALGLDDRIVDHVPELADSGYAPCAVRDVLTMTSGVDWMEDHRDPTSLGQPAGRLLRSRWRRVASAAGRGRPATAPRHPLGVLHGRLAGPRLGA
jgi:CubicO group peptidase (beta-lactamase class C family)